MAKLEAAYTTSHSQSEERSQDLQERLSRAQEAVKQLETRRALDQEGWASDVTLLRRQLSAVDRSEPQVTVRSTSDACADVPTGLRLYSATCINFCADCVQHTCPSMHLEMSSRRPDKLCDPPVATSSSLNNSTTLNNSSSEGPQQY